MVESR